MRRVVVNGIMIFICFMLQTSIFSLWKLADVVPNIFIILVSSMSVMRGQKEGMLVGFFSGLMLDVLYSPYIGMYAFLYMFLGFIDGYFHRVYYDNDTLLPLLLIGANDFVYGMLMYLVYGVLRNHLNFMNYAKSTIVPELVYTVAVGLILYRVLLPINRWLENHEKGSADFV